MKPRKKEKIGIIGLGHIGLPLLAVFAKAKNFVIGLDINQKRLEHLKKTFKADFYEPYLNDILKKFKEKIEFTDNYSYLMKECNSIIIVVGTSLLTDDLPNFNDLDKVIDSISKHLRPGQVIILKSTVLPGVTREIARKLEKITRLKAGLDFYLAFCPERVIEGKVIEELSTLPKITGGINQKSSDKVAKILKKLGGKIIKVSSPEVAELCKLLDNTYRVANIAFSNEIGLICEKIGVDSYEVVKTANKFYDRTNLFLPSLGAGGPCLSKDPQVLSYFAKKNKIHSDIINTCIKGNKYSTLRVADIVIGFLKENKIKKPVISLIGLAFKGRPETDDIRNSPAVDIKGALEGKIKNINFQYYDPLVKNFFDKKTAKNLKEAIKNSNVVMFLTNHRKLMNIDAGFIVKNSGRPLLIIDCWHNLKNLNNIQDKKIEIYRIGDKKYGKN